MPHLVQEPQSIAPPGKIIQALKENLFDGSWFPAVPDPLLSDCVMSSRGAFTIAHSLNMPYGWFSYEMSTVWDLIALITLQCEEQMIKKKKKKDVSRVNKYSVSVLEYLFSVYLYSFIRDTKASYARIFILTLKDRMQPMKRRTAKTRHMLLVDMISSLYGNVPG